jgi:threonine dehydrogenase-like Zn-dependent dehydrogenase
LAGLFGYSHFTGGYAGGQAEYARVPFADNNLLKIPDSVPDEKALYLSDIIPTSYQAVLCAEVEKGNSIAIWGLGPIGLLAAQWSRHFGARRIIAIDNVPERLALAKDKFNCDVINFDEQKDVVSAIYGLEPQGVTNAIDAAAFRYSKSVSHAIQRAMCLETDTPEILNEALRATRKFGTIALVADYAATTNGLLIGAIMEKGLTVRGTGQTPVQKYWHDMLAKVESGEFDPTTVLTHRYKIEDLAEVYAIFDRKEGGVLKTFVQTKFSRPKAEGTPELTRLERTSESD